MVKEDVLPDIPTLEAELSIIKSYGQRVNEIDDQMRKLIATPTDDQGVLALNRWEDRCVEYIEKVAYATHRIIAAKERVQKATLGNGTKPQIGGAQSNANSSVLSTSASEVIVRQEIKIPKFSGDAKKFRDWFESHEAAVADCKNSLA